MYELSKGEINQVSGSGGVNAADTLSALVTLGVAAAKLGQEAFGWLLQNVDKVAPAEVVGDSMTDLKG